MKIYISGPMSMLIEAGREDEMKMIFDTAERNLTYLGFEVVNPFYNGLSTKDKWIKHILKDLELEDPCDAICYLHTWELFSSPGGEMEKIVARREKKLEIREIKKDNGEYEYVFIN